MMAKQLVTNFITQKVENFQLTEKCSATAVKTLLLSQKILNEDEKNVLRGYQKNTELKGKFRVATIEYSDNIGRLNASIVGEANPGMVQMYLNNSIKCNILNGVYSDLDIVSCHPTIILQLCEIYSLPTTNIKKLLFQNVQQRVALPLVDVQWDLVLVVCLLKPHVAEQLKTIALMFSK